MSHERTFRNNTSPHAPLSDAELQRIIDAIFQLMRETGVKFDPVPEIMDTLSEAKCEISGDGIVKFPTDLVRKCIDSTTKSVRLWDRTGADYLDISCPHSVFLTDLSPPNFIDIDTGERRPITKEDIAMISRVADALPDIDGLEAVGRISEIDNIAAIMANSTKPLHIAFEDPVAMEAGLEMAAAVRGGMAQLKEKPYILVCVSVMPLRYTKNELDQMLRLLENDIPVAMGTMGIGGISTPITIAGNVVNCFASDLAGLVLSQLLKKGSFCMIGSTISFIDPATGGLGAMNEFILAEMVKCQVARHFGIPLHFANAGVSMGKEFNQETVFGTTATMIAGIFCQATCCSWAGTLDALIAYSPHALLLCNELVGTARRMWKGVTVDDETLALDVTHKVGPTGDYIAEKHSANYCRKEISPIKYFASKTFDTWRDEGSRELKDVIEEDLRKILATHKPEPLPSPIQKQLDAIVEKCKVG